MRHARWSGQSFVRFSSPPESSFVRSILTSLTAENARSGEKHTQKLQRAVFVAERVKRTLGLSKASTAHSVNSRGRTSFLPPEPRMLSHLEFLTVPTADTPGTGVFLVFDDKRYFFGHVHEGVQRVAIESGAKLAKLREIFMTGVVGTETFSGLLGMSLTLFDVLASAAEQSQKNLELKRRRYQERLKEEEERLKKHPQGKPFKPNKLSKPSEEVEEPKSLGVHGGPNLTHAVATARSYIFRQGLKFTVEEYAKVPRHREEEPDWRPTWSDDRIRVWAMAVDKESGSESAPNSPRKRSLGEYISNRVEGYLEKASVSQNANVQAIRENAVREMFMSEWHKNKYFETPLHEIDPLADIRIRDPDTGELQKYAGPFKDGKPDLPGATFFMRQPWPGALIEDLPNTNPSSVALSYIVRNQSQRGRFIPEKAKLLGVKPGPLFTKLSSGEEVVSTSGETITPDMVLEPATEGSGFAILDVPSKAHLNSLLQRPEWQVDKIVGGTKVFVWLLGPGVADDERLKSFIEDRKDKKHVISSPDYCVNELTMTSAASATVRHEVIDPERYSPLLFDSSSPLMSPRSPEMSTLPSDTEIARPGLKFLLEPSFKKTQSPVVKPVNLSEAAQSIKQSVLDLAGEAKNSIAKMRELNKSSAEDLPSPDAEIICLGTGSAMPSLHRNVSGTLLRVPGYGSYLFDCGESTLGQMKRIFSPSELAEILRDLKMIWISHLHADHHLGTASVIKAWSQEVHGQNKSQNERASSDKSKIPRNTALEVENPLFLIGNRYLHRALSEFSDVDDFGYDRVIPLQPEPVRDDNFSKCSLYWNGQDCGLNTAEDPLRRSAIAKALGLSNLVVCNVRHCLGAHAISVTFPNGFKFSYSGDCRPSERFAKIGAGSTVLVHEATFDDEHLSDAKAKRHSTISEAIRVGTRMQARNVILTHFSQRFSDIPSMDDIKRSLQTPQPLVEDEELDEEDDLPPVKEAGHVESEKENDLQPVTETDQVERNDASISNAELSPQSDNVEPVPHDNQGSADTTSFPMESDPPVVTPINVGVAFDYMRVRVKDIQYLEKFTPALSELYKEEEKHSLEENGQDNMEDGAAVDAENSEKKKQKIEAGDLGEGGEVKESNNQRRKREKKEQKEAAMKAEQEANIEQQAVEEAKLEEKPIEDDKMEHDTQNTLVGLGGG